MSKPICTCGHHREWHYNSGCARCRCRLTEHGVSDTIIADLLEALKKQCHYHHKPLIDGWAHDVIGKHIRCELKPEAIALVARMEEK